MQQNDPHQARIHSSSSDASNAIFSVDVEDWFHILDLASTPDVATWESYPSRVERNFRQLLELFDAAGASVTCFFLGWVAERFPRLVQEAVEAGHEVASHGYAHVLTYELTPDEFLADIRHAKRLIEDASGQPVRGYRAPGFSVTAKTPWFFDKLAEAGYQYDSSVFPAPRQHGGISGHPREPHVVSTPHGSIVEFPISVARVLGKSVCFSGGGYLRIFPYELIKRVGRRIIAEGQPLIFYAHPREIDAECPRLPMGLIRRFKSYVGLRTTRPKLQAIFRDFRCTTFGDYLDRNPIEVHT